MCIIHSQAYYMSSGLSFYFIYDFCLYHGMSAPISYFLRYLPLSVALVTSSTVLVIRYVIILYYSIVLQFKRLKLLLSCWQYQMNLFSLTVDQDLDQVASSLDKQMYSCACHNVQCAL